MSRLVPAKGPLDAEVVIVGRDPGTVETMRGEPFCGPSGELLTELCELAGLKRRECLVTNVVPVQPAGNKWEAHREGEVEKGAAELYELLAKHKRKLVIALGEQALHASLGMHPDDGRYESTEVRGYIFEGPWGPVLSCLHPAFALRQWHPNYELTRRDFGKAKRFLGGSRYSKDRRAEWTRSVAEARAAVENSRTAPRTAVDIETGADGSVRCVGFATGAEAGLTIPYGGQYVGVVETLLQREGLVFHNGQFDVTVLRRQGHKIADGFDDTMLMWHSLEPTLAGQREARKGKKRSEKSLRFLAGLLTFEPFWKDYEFHKEEERWVLCAKDARVTWEVAEELMRRLRQDPYKIEY